MTSILVVGSANIDFTLTMDRLPSPGETLMADGFHQIIGGKGVNQAVASARAGGSVSMVACVGEDDYGQIIRKALHSEGIEAVHVFSAPAPSGVAVVMTAASGDNMIAVVAGANAMLLPSMLSADQFSGGSVVLCQLEMPMNTVLRASELARAAGATFILDPAPAQPLPLELLELTDWVTPNESEARTLVGQPKGELDAVAVAREIRGMGAKNVLVKLGARGSLLLGEDGNPIFIAAPAVEAIDTTAAGDSFNGAFAVALGEGANPENAARFASAASALAVTRRGASDAMPFRNEIDRLVSFNTLAASVWR